MKKKNVVAGGVLVALIGGLLAFMGDKWFGSGGGDGEGAGDGDEVVNVNPNDPQTPTPDKAAEEAAAVVDVVIDGTEYQVLQADKTRKPVALADVVKLIEAADGNADGIKARIARKDTSALNVERALGEAIQAAKIPDSAVRWIHEPVK